MYSAESKLSDQDRATLLRVARQSVGQGLLGENRLPEIENCSLALLDPGASFVTLKMDNRLRGCIGSLEARRPLLADVHENAFAAAFRDPRFPALNQSEYERLDFHISVLSAARPMSFESEADLLAQLRPQIDGLIIEEGYRRGTFLPSVWESLPEPGQFLAQLKLKAGLPANYWSEQLRVSRYTCESIS
jgi:AmmeMemoRadiSam system protein A